MLCHRTNKELFQRYLAYLDVVVSKSDFTTLGHLMEAHLDRIPFENISKMLRFQATGARDLVGLSEFISNLETSHLGGTCYTNNYFFNRLLNHLGFEACLCGADMDEPDVHLVNIVSLNDRRYLVDVGYAAPFLVPIPLDSSEDHVVEWGLDRYVLRPADKLGRSRLDHFRDGSLIHGYRLNSQPRNINEFMDVIADSYRDDAMFRNNLYLARFNRQRSVVIHNDLLTKIYSGRVKRQILEDEQNLVDAIESNFAISGSLVEKVLPEVAHQFKSWK